MVDVQNTSTINYQFSSPKNFGRFVGLIKGLRIMLKNSGTKRSLITTLLLSLPLGASASATILTSNQFTTLTSPGWALGAQDGGTVSISTDTSLNYNGGATSVVGKYPTASGGVYVWGSYDVSALKTEDIYIEFWAKMPGAKQGLKFLKIFGGRASDGSAANTTFGMNYTGGDNGSLYQVSFGDGSTPFNDTQNVINLDGTYPSWIGRSYGHATVATPQKSAWASSNWGTNWHHFKMHVKFKSGNSGAAEVADGQYYLEIDGKVYADASGLFNRNYTNGPIDSIQIFGWAQGGSTPFEIWYSNVVISTGGFVSTNSATSAPMPPSELKVTPQ